MLELESGRPENALASCAELALVAARMGSGSEAPFAVALDALARLGLNEPGAPQRFEVALAELRRIDSNRLLAYALSSPPNSSCAGAMSPRRSSPPRASERAA
ncbi:MAG: hypothetical protein ACREM1_01235 [Longimicrobiales bacterium]